MSVIDKAVQQMQTDTKVSVPMCLWLHYKGKHSKQTKAKAVIVKQWLEKAIGSLDKMEDFGLLDIIFIDKLFLGLKMKESEKGLVKQVILKKIGSESIL